MCETELHVANPTDTEDTEDTNMAESLAYFDPVKLRTSIVAYGSCRYDNGFNYGLLCGLCAGFGIGIGIGILAGKLDRM